MSSAWDDSGIMVVKLGVELLERLDTPGLETGTSGARGTTAQE